MKNMSLVAVLVAILGMQRAIAGEVVVTRDELDKQGRILISTSDDQVARDAALGICSLVASKSESDTVSTELIGNLTRALRMKDNRVRYFAVRSLALIGPKAVIALPELRKLLDAERNPPPGTIMMGISPIPRIQNAIEVIEGKTNSVRPPVTEECERPQAH